MDKLLHFGVSFVLARLDPMLAVFAGIGKEIADYFGAGTADLLDLLADLLGVVAALALG